MVNSASKLEHVQSILKNMGKVMVTYSGGVDSTLLLKISKNVLGKNVLAVTALSPVTPKQEFHEALKIVEDLKVEHIVIKTNEMECVDFTANNPDRCYICKKIRLSFFSRLAKERNIDWIVDGGNQDDLKDFRPGSIATNEYGVRSPMQEAELSKVEIRELSKQFGLHTWNKPSQACLASRIPYYSRITFRKLQQVDEAESFLRELGFNYQLRLRHHGILARIELDPVDFPRILDSTIRQKIIRYLEELGFSHVALDLSGYKMGSFNTYDIETEGGMLSGARTN